MSKIYLKRYSVKELAVLYEVNVKTLKRWLEPYKTQIGNKNGHFYSPKQIKTIFKSLGMPDKTGLHKN